MAERAALSAFWLAATLLLYVYVGYPVVIAVWAKVRVRQRVPR